MWKSLIVENVFSAEKVRERFDEILDEAADEAVQLPLACHAASKVYEDVQNANAEIEAQVTKT